MPTLFDNFAYVFERYVWPQRGRVFYVAKCALVLVFVAALLEVFVFNFNYWATAGNKPINLRSQITLAKSVDGTFRLTAVDHTMEFSNLNTYVDNIRVDFDTSQPAQNLTLKIQFTDEAHSTYFDTTEYTVGVPDATVSTASVRSQYISLNTSGTLNNLRIEVTGDDVSYPIKLNTVELNARYPFDFRWLRFWAALFVLAVVYMFRPRSAIYRINMVDAPRASKAGVVAAVCVEGALISAFLFFGSNLVGVATSSYNYGEWDGYSLVNTFEVGGDNAQQYAELARSMAEGKLYLSEDPPDWLKEMSDPYDKGARDELQKQTGQDYLFDVAYYDGHYYVYFGVVPVLLFYLPFYLLTGANFPTAIGVLIAVLAFVLGCSSLLDRFARYHFKRVSLGIYLLLQVGMVSCCGVLYLIKFPTFYSLPIACGLAFSVWGLYFWMCGRGAESRRAIKVKVGKVSAGAAGAAGAAAAAGSVAADAVAGVGGAGGAGGAGGVVGVVGAAGSAAADAAFAAASREPHCAGASRKRQMFGRKSRGTRGVSAAAAGAPSPSPSPSPSQAAAHERVNFVRCGFFLAGSLCMALVAGCRPQLLVLSALAFPLFWRAYISERRIATRAGAVEFACLVAPYLVVAAGIMFYNYARFGSFTDFGANYNLTVNDMTKRGWNVGRLAPAAFAYFFQPPNVVGTFPFLQAVEFATTYMGQTIKEATFGGIFACLPMLWVLLFARPCLRMRNAARRTRTISGVILVLVVSGVAVALLDAEMAGILQRYFADFSFMFLAAAMLCAFIINENISDVSPARPIFLKVAIVLVTISVAYSVLLCFVPETGWYSSIYPWAYKDVLQMFAFWT